MAQLKYGSSRALRRVRTGVAEAAPPLAESSNQRAALVQVLRGGVCAGETGTYHATSFQTGEKEDSYHC